MQNTTDPKGPATSSLTAQRIASRVAAVDWSRVEAELDAFGVGRLGPLLTPRECAAVAALYEEDARFRSRIAMARHGFGRGEYRYFAYPLPAAIESLRRTVYPHAARVANRWAALLGLDCTYPPSLSAMLRRCHDHGQRRPTPLLLKYAAGDFNCLHQDVYGEQLFPLQLVVLLSDPVRFAGGEFVLTEQRPRMQSRVEVVPLAQGEAALFAVNQRPRQGTRGYHRVKLRHGVSRVRRGERIALGVIFHDAA